MVNAGYVENHRETVHHLLSGCKKLLGTEYVKRHEKTLKVLAVKCTLENGLLPEGTKWYTTNWERGKVIEKDAKKLFWGWKHPIRTDCVARRPDFTMEDTSKKTILLIDVACSNESNKRAKRDERIRNIIDYALNYENDEKTMKVIHAITECLGGGMKKLKESMRQIFEYDNNDKKPEWISREM